MKHIMVVTEQDACIGLWPAGRIEIVSTLFDGLVSFATDGQVVNISAVKSIKGETF